MRHDNVGGRADTGSIGGIRGSKLGEHRGRERLGAERLLVERVLELDFLGERVLGGRVVGELPRRRVAGSPPREHLSKVHAERLERAMPIPLKGESSRSPMPNVRSDLRRCGARHDDGQEEAGECGTRI